MREEREDFAHLELGPGIELYLNPTPRFKTTRIDIFLRAMLQPRRNTCIALIGRLLERGTRRLPDLRAVNSFVDCLYGAVFGVEVESLGNWQVIHLFMEVLDAQYLDRSTGNLLSQGIDFLHEVLREPAQEEGGFRRDYLRQEKAALRQQIDALFNDKTLYAQRRCLEAMSRGEPFGLSPLGDPRDFRGIRATSLLRFYFDILSRHPISVFASGNLAEGIIRRWEEFFDWERRAAPLELPTRAESQAIGGPRWICEHQEVSQGRLVLGYRTPIRLGDPEYPALALFNLLWGGDSHSRLFRYLREEGGLCYSIFSSLDPLSGLLFVTAGVEEEDGEAVFRGIEAQLEAIRRQEFAPAELEAVRTLLLDRLESLADDRAGLAQFYYRYSLVCRPCSRRQFSARLAAVKPEEVSRAASTLELDTLFFLSRDRAGARFGA